MKFIAAQLRQQHVDGAFCRRFSGKLIALDAARQITFAFRFADRLAANEFHSERGHALKRRHHARDGGTGVDDIEIFSIQASADVVFVHACYRHDGEPLLRGLTDRAAGDAVTAALKRGASDQQVWFIFSHSLDQLVDCLLLVLGKIVVTAKYRRDDFAVLAQRLLQRAARADKTVFDLRADVGFVFCADLGEELIQVMDDANFAVHAVISNAQRSLNCRKGVFPAKALSDGRSPSFRTETRDLQKISPGACPELCRRGRNDIFFLPLRLCAFAGDHSEFSLNSYTSSGAMRPPG